MITRSELATALNTALTSEFGSEYQIIRMTPGVEYEINNAGGVIAFAIDRDNLAFKGGISEQRLIVTILFSVIGITADVIYSLIDDILDRARRVITNMPVLNKARSITGPTEFFVSDASIDITQVNQTYVILSNYLKGT